MSKKVRSLYSRAKFHGTPIGNLSQGAFAGDLKDQAGLIGDQKLQEAESSRSQRLLIDHLKADGLYRRDEDQRCFIDQLKSWKLLHTS